MNFHFLEPDELLALLKAARAESQRDYTMLLCQFSHAMRASEVCDLRLGDIKDGCVTVRRRKGSKLTVQPLVRHRGTPLLDEARALKEWMEVRPKDSGDALFPSEKGGCLSPNAYNRRFHYHAAKIGLPPEKSHSHTLKHSLITALVRKGMDIAAVQQYAGHRSISSTLLYTHLCQKEVCDKAQSKLMDVFG